MRAQRGLRKDGVRGALTNVKRWATEQWDGPLLPGNINPRETHIERSDLDAWRSGR